MQATFTPWQECACARVRVCIYSKLRLTSREWDVRCDSRSFSSQCTQSAAQLSTSRLRGYNPFFLPNAIFFLSLKGELIFFFLMVSPVLPNKRSLLIFFSWPCRLFKIWPIKWIYYYFVSLILGLIETIYKNGGWNLLN